MKRALVLVLLLTTPAFADDPSPIEDHNFFLEQGWNRDDAVLQSTSSFLYGHDAWSYELAQEWAVSSPRHQLSYTIPIFTDGKTGLGDVALNYRYQLIGGEESRIAIAPRASLILPTRNEHFGERSSGVQLNVPVSAKITDRLGSHTNIGATWFRERRSKEINLAQSFVFDATPRIAISVDAAYTRCFTDPHLFVVRPGVQFTLASGSGLQVSPGIAVPVTVGSGRAGVLLFVSLEHPLR